jgi:hypothetical protein
MKQKLFIFLLLAGSIIPNLLFAQFTQQGPKLVGTNTVGSLVYQGCSVSISSDGNTAIVGGYGDNGSSGAVWVFIRSGNVWTQQGSKLVGTGGGGSTGQGVSVAISSDGNTAITGGPGLGGINTGGVWIFTRSGGVWTQQGPELVGTGSVGASNQGSSVAISSDGNTAVEGGSGDSSSSGAIWIFTRSSGVWSQQGPKLVGTGAVPTAGRVYQGISVSISSDGNTLIEGGYWDNGEAGAVWVFTRSGGVWTQQGSKLVGTGAVGGVIYQGTSVSISSDGNTFVEGGFFDNSSGAIWVFTRSGGVWTQQGPKLFGSGGIGYTYQGYSVAISSDGNTAVSGGYSDDTSRGAVWVFHRNGGVWTQLGPKFVGSNPVGYAFQGYSVAISSEGTVIEGGPSDNNNLGAAWVFRDPTIGIKAISQSVPESYSLSQNYPNPFNPSTVIKFQVAGSRFVKLSIYDVLGREVSTLVNEQLKPGTYEVDWNASNYPSGVYFYKLAAGDYVETKKMILIK